MSLELINVEQGSQDWHNLREKFYKTASRTPIVCDVSPFQTKEQLAMQLRGEYEPFYNKAMQLGNELEDEVRTLAEIKLNDTFNPLVGVNDSYLASLDGINFDRDTIIEIKVSKHTFNKLVNNEIPDNYYYQIQHQMMVFDDVEKAYLVAYNPETMQTAYSDAILPDLDVFKEIKESWSAFDKEKDTLKVKEFDLSDNNDFLLAVDDYKACKKIEEKAKLETERAKEHLLSFYQGGKTIGAGATISKAKDSVGYKYDAIYKQNKELLKNVDLEKYKTVKKGSYRITIK